MTFIQCFLCTMNCFELSTDTSFNWHNKVMKGFCYFFQFTTEKLGG